MITFVFWKRNLQHVHFQLSGGWYVFIETSWPRKQNETARLMSSLIPATSQMCFDFWYHMYGDDIGNLTVYSKTKNSMTVLWQKSGTQGPRWRHATVDVSSASQFSVSIIKFKLLPIPHL